jgi:serine/threonine protein phosphatase PrpC
LIDAALKNGGRDNVTVIIVSALASALDKSIVGELKNEINKDTLTPEE